MKKKSSIIYAVVGLVIVGGLVISQFVDWPVDSDNADGDIAKSSHFSRKSADAVGNNMQELIQNDEDFKNGVVTAYVVMKTRAEQFNALVDMSAEVAGNYKEFESLIKEMKEAQPMVKNVCASIETVGKNLDTALGGEEVSELEQSTANAALAYNSLQKQNKLADQFIEAVDNYLKNADANDRLKFVRDQWVDYQQMTASMNNDEKLAEELGKKGYLLSEDKRANALGSFNTELQLASLRCSSLSSMCGLNNALANTVPSQVMQMAHVLNANADVQLKAKAESSLGAQADIKLNDQASCRKILWNTSSLNNMQNLQSSFQEMTLNLANGKVLGQMSQVNEAVKAMASSDLGAIMTVE